MNTERREFLKKSLPLLLGGLALLTGCSGPNEALSKPAYEIIKGDWEKGNDPKLGTPRTIMVMVTIGNKSETQPCSYGHSALSIVKTFFPDDTDIIIRDTPGSSTIAGLSGPWGFTVNGLIPAGNMKQCRIIDSCVIAIVDPEKLR